VAFLRAGAGGPPETGALRGIAQELRDGAGERDGVAGRDDPAALADRLGEPAAVRDDRREARRHGPEQGMARALVAHGREDEEVGAAVEVGEVLLEAEEAHVPGESQASRALAQVRLELALAGDAQDRARNPRAHLSPGGEQVLVALHRREAADGGGHGRHGGEPEGAPEALPIAARRGREVDSVLEQREALGLEVRRAPAHGPLDRRAVHQDAPHAAPVEEARERIAPRGARDAAALQQGGARASAGEGARAQIAAHVGHEQVAPLRAHPAAQSRGHGEVPERARAGPPRLEPQDPGACEERAALVAGDRHAMAESGERARGVEAPLLAAPEVPDRVQEDDLEWSGFLALARDLEEEPLGQGELRRHAVAQGELPCRQASRAPAPGIGPEDELFLQGRHALLEGDHRSLTAVFDELGASVRLGGDHGEARCERLERRVGERVVARREHVEIRRAIAGLRIAASPEEAHVGSQARALGAPREAPSGGVVAHHEEARLGRARAQRRERREQVVESLPGVARPEEEHHQVLGREPQGRPQRGPGSCAQAGMEAFQVDPVVDRRERNLGDPVPLPHVAPDPVRVRDHPAVGPGGERTLLDPLHDAVAQGEPRASEGALERSSRGEARQGLEVARVESPAQPHDVVRPGLAQSEDEVVGVPLQVRFEGAREAPRAPGLAQGGAMEHGEPHVRVRGPLVPPADDRDLVAALGQEGGELVQVALGPSRMRVPHVSQGDPHRAFRIVANGGGHHIPCLTMIKKDRARPARVRALLLVLFVAASASAFRACGRDPEHDSWALYQRFLSAGSVEFHVPSGPLEARVAELARGLSLQEGLDARVLVGGGEGDAELPRVVFGTSDDPRVVDLALRLGIRRLEPAGFAWLGRDYRSPSDAILARLEDPERPGLPFVFVLGNDARALSKLVRELPAPWEGGFATFKHGEPALEVRATVDGSPVLETLVDRASERARFARATEERNRGGIRFHVPAGIPEERWWAYAERCLAARDRVRSWLGREGGRVPEVFLYEHPEDLERSLGISALAWGNPLGPRVHALLAEGVPDDGGAEIARATALELLGDPAEPWMLSGIAVAAAGSWWGRSLEDWLAHLERARALPSAEELVCEEAARTLSEHVLLPARAGRFLDRLEAWETEGVVAAWRGRPPRAPVPIRARPGGRDVLAPRATGGPPTWRGVALVDAPGRRGGLASSYASRATEGTLRRVRELGANAVSFSVEATLEPLRRTFARLDERAVHGSVSDVGLFHAAASARALGLASLLWVQPLNAPGGTRADAFGLIDRQDFTFFFQRLDRIGTHYGCLAELAGVEVLCLGEGLDTAAGTLGLEPRQRSEQVEAWRTSWARLRPLYAGIWTYAAGSLSQAGLVEFWDALDLVALQSWPSFAGPIVASELSEIAAVLRAEIEGARELGASTGRDVLFVQSGFPACDGAWPRTNVPRGEPDLESQRRFYAALGSALEAGEVAPFSGFFLWSVPANGRTEGAGPFSVLARPAEAELPRLLRGP